MASTPCLSVSLGVLLLTLLRPPDITKLDTYSVHLCPGKKSATQRGPWPEAGLRPLGARTFAVLSLTAFPTARKAGECVGHPQGWHRVQLSSWLAG